MMGWSPKCYIPSFVEICLPVPEKIFEGFLPYMGVAAILGMWPALDCEPECRMLPTPREFCRHILSERITQAGSNKRRLHPVSGGISL